MSSADPSTGRSHLEYVYVRSQGAHTWHLVGRFAAFIGSAREIWIGSDGSGAIREASGPVSFFTDEGHARWEAPGSPELARGPVVEFYGPGELSDRTRRLPSDPDALAAELMAGPPLTLKAAYHLLGETCVSAEFTRVVFDVAMAVEAIETLDVVADQLGRRGHGLAAVERGERLELIFDEETTTLLGHQRFLADPSHAYAPVGTLVSWQAYLDRRRLDALPAQLRDPPGSRDDGGTRPAAGMIEKQQRCRRDSSRRQAEVRRGWRR